MMSKRQFKGQASSSSRLPTTEFGGFGLAGPTSVLSYTTDSLVNIDAINDPNIGVIFKSLLKKDGTTKAKALEELRSHLVDQEGEQNVEIDPAILSAWSTLYPRLSIENSRIVRELTQTDHFKLLRHARKRIEKHIPDIVGAWIAATYDRDRQVSKVATEALSSFLDSESKRLNFLKKCQAQILQYAQAAIEETAKSLSDERIVTADEAQAKYDRVISSSLSLVTNLLLKLSKDDIQKEHGRYEDYLSGHVKLWAFMSSEDPYVRRSTAQLLEIALDKEIAIVEQDAHTISHHFIGKALRSAQTGSSLQLVQALDRLSVSLPQVWTTAYKDKKSPLSKLLYFIQQGPQGGGPEFWKALAHLIKILPTEILPTDGDGRIEFLNAYRNGINNRGQARSAVYTAWNSYLDTVKFLSSHHSELDIDKLITTSVFPLFQQYLHPESAAVQWNLGTNHAPLIKAFGLCATAARKTCLRKEWNRLSDLLMSDIGSESGKSGAIVVDEVRRWFTLETEILESITSIGGSKSELVDILTDTSLKILNGSILAIRESRGENFGAAGAIIGLLSLPAEFVIDAPEIWQVVEVFFNSEFLDLILSPSSELLVASLNSFEKFRSERVLFRKAWISAVERIVMNSESPNVSTVLRRLMVSPGIDDLAHRSQPLQQFLSIQLADIITGNSRDWPLLNDAIIHDVLDSSTLTEIMKCIVKALVRTSPDTKRPLDALQLLARHKPDAVKNNEEVSRMITTRLLSLVETADPQTANKIKNIQQLMEGHGDESGVSSQIAAILRDGLDTANSQSLSVEILVDQARSLHESHPEETMNNLLPSLDIWKGEVSKLFVSRPNSKLSLMNSLGGTVSIVQPMEDKLAEPVSYDASGYSIAIRMGLYTAQILPQLYKDLSSQVQIDLLRLLGLILELAKDQLGLQDKNKLWMSSENSAVEAKVLEFLSAAQKCFALASEDTFSWRSCLNQSVTTKTGGLISSLIGASPLGNRSSQVQTSTLGSLISFLVDASRGSTASAYYAARTLSTLLNEVVEMHGWQASEGEEWLTSVSVFKSSTTDVFTAAAILTGLGEVLKTSKLVSTFCNRLISDATGVSAGSPKTVGILLLLNATLSIFNPEDIPVPNNRLVFAVKHFCDMLKGQITSSPATEVFRALQKLFPSVKGVYGSYWTSSLEACVELWKADLNSTRLDSQLPTLHASVKTYSILRSLKDANDDLEDALKVLKQHLSEGLIHLLSIPRIQEDQPLEIFDGLLTREVSKIPVSSVKDVSIIYPLLASEFQLVQSAAYHLLRQVLPAAQQQISYEALLDDADVELPIELLSLLLDAPNIQDIPEDALTKFPASIRTYLFSWHLVFDCFTNAVPKVRKAYSDQLKDEKVVAPLLELIFDVLGHADATPLKLDRDGFTSDMIQSYDLELAKAETDTKNMQWLLINLYCLALKLIPRQVRAWYIDLKSKSIRNSIESWTTRYFSPLVVSEMLDEAAIFVDSQDLSPDEEAVTIKISKQIREVIVSYPIDDAFAQIAIRLAPSYPLEGIKAETVKRVAIGEKRWNSWLLSITGSIMFSNTLSDGIAYFRKNISAAMKGNTECAICYSYIDTEQRKPERKCSTCKNLFHTSCLQHWFETSNQSSCPLCRQEFTFAGFSSAKTKSKRRQLVVGRQTVRASDREHLERRGFVADDE